MDVIIDFCAVFNDGWINCAARDCRQSTDFNMRPVLMTMALLLDSRDKLKTDEYWERRSLLLVAVLDLR